MRGLVILMIVSILHCSHGLCKVLRQRSFAPFQPFQIPLNAGEELPYWVYALKYEPWSMIMDLSDGWLYVYQHNCSSHLEVLKAFRCD